MTEVDAAMAGAWQVPAEGVRVRENGREAWRQLLVRVSMASAAVLIPCFWQQRIEAGDLRSHVYNAWLVQLIERGQAPGLWVAQMRNNVLFDYLLSALARIFSLPVVTRVAAGIAVLTFFWGSFAFVRAITGRNAWPLVPLLAVIAYGWTFQEGLLNYYLSVGLAFAGLGLFLLRRDWRRWVPVAVIFPLAFLAHPIGAAWMLGAAVYLAIAEAVPRRLHALLVCSGIAVVVVARWQLQSHYRVEGPSSSALYNLVFYTGLDQLMLSPRYAIPVLLVAIYFAVAILFEAKKGKGVRELLAGSSIPLQLYLMIQAAILLLPNSIYLTRYPAPISALTTRFTSISAVLLCALLGTVGTQRWRLPFLSCCAAFYFLFLYQDTALLNRMEDQVESLVRSLPADQRVISTIGGPAKYRFSTKHMVELPCIGRCFSYGNYEAPSGQFRVRASPGNNFVVSDIHAATLMEEGRYVVQLADLPLYQLYQCSPEWTVLCLRPLKAGETNDAFGVHQGRDVGKAIESPAATR